MLADEFIGPELQASSISRFGYLHAPVAAGASVTMQANASVSRSPAANSCQHLGRIASQIPFWQ